MTMPGYGEFVEGPPVAWVGPDRFAELRAGIILYMAEDHLDWRDIHENTLAELCGVDSTGYFTWDWVAARAGLADKSEGDW